MWLGMARGRASARSSPAAAAPFTALAGYPLAFLGWVAHGRAAAARDASSVAARSLVAARLRSRAARGDRWSPAARRPRPRGGAPSRVLTLRPSSRAAPRPRRPGRRRRPALRVTFLDIGQGDATLIQHGGARASSSTPARPTGRRRAAARTPGSRGSTCSSSTHAQADHDGGAAGGAARAAGRPACSTAATACATPAGWRWRPRRRARGVPARRAGRRASAARRARSSCDVLWPPRARPPRARAGADPNDRAIVRSSARGALRAAADRRRRVRRARRRSTCAPVDVLKVSHHGSADPGLPGAARSGCGRGVAVIEVGARQHLRPPGARDARARCARPVPRVYAPTATARVRLDVDAGGDACDGGADGGWPRPRPRSRLAARADLQARLPDPRRRPRPHRRAPRAAARARRGASAAPAGVELLRGRRRDARGRRGWR